jgi:hypothetical protein
MASNRAGECGNCGANFPEGASITYSYDARAVVACASCHGSPGIATAPVLATPTLPTLPAANPSYTAAPFRISLAILAALEGAAALPLARCGICNKALRDPKSVELGIGPDCAKHYGQGQDALFGKVVARLRPLAKSALRALSAAMGEGNAALGLECCAILRSLGLGTLSDACEANIAVIKMANVDKQGTAYVSVSFAKAANLRGLWYALKRCNGVEWVAEPGRKGAGHFLAPATSAFKNAIAACMAKNAVGVTGSSPAMGFFQVPEWENAGTAKAWKVNAQGLSSQAMEDAAARLEGAKDEEVKDAALAFRRVLAGQQIDWRPSEMLPEDYYAA